MPKGIKEIIKPATNRLETTYLVLPEHTNFMGNIFGGTIMSWIDTTAAIVAFRHCRSIVVTAAMDDLSFLSPVHLGDMVNLKAAVNFTSKRTIEIGVKVWAENPITGKTRHTSSAYLSFVSLNKKNKAQLIKPVTPKTIDEKRRFKEGERRYKQRLKKRN
ncbi:hypothetical protein BVY03_03830 [bacterium K02(2017)]|nr:hypothetical protein BVY03_03830 [bacterium K02(2017)]